MIQGDAQLAAYLGNRWCWHCGGVRPCLRYIRVKEPITGSQQLTLYEPLGWTTWYCRICGHHVPSMLVGKIQKIVEVIEEPGQYKVLVPYNDNDQS